MATGQLYYNVRFADGTHGSGEFPDHTQITEENFFYKDEEHKNDLVAALGYGVSLTRVGIQAPPGTQIIFNEDHPITIGRTGIYEIEAEIKNMYIIRVANYIHKEQQERTDKNAGANDMKDAVQRYWENFFSLHPIPTVEASTEVWNTFDASFKVARNEFDELYSTGLGQYLTGLNGEYEIDSQKPYVDVENLIIDYQYDS